MRGGDYAWLRGERGASLLSIDDLAPVDPHGLYRETPSGLLVPRSPRDRRTLRAAALFCGCGGFSLGMQEAGINVVAAVEWEPTAIQTYLLNLGSTSGCAVAYVDEADRARHQKLLRKQKERRDGSGCRAMVMGDAGQITGDLVREALAAIGDSPLIDVVIGGPPCQGMSTAGRQKPDDPRNNLVLEFVRLADELGAEVFMMENVPPLLTQAKYRPLLEQIVARAQAAGFSITATVLNAADYGVPQIRRRAFVVGTRGEAAERPFTFGLPTTWAFGATTSGRRWSFLDQEPDGGDDGAGSESGTPPGVADQLNLFEQCEP